MSGLLQRCPVRMLTAALLVFSLAASLLPPSLSSASLTGKGLSRLLAGSHAPIGVQAGKPPETRHAKANLAPPPVLAPAASRLMEGGRAPAPPLVSLRDRECGIGSGRSPPSPLFPS